MFKEELLDPPVVLRLPEVFSTTEAWFADPVDVLSPPEELGLLAAAFMVALAHTRVLRCIGPMTTDFSEQQLWQLWTPAPENPFGTRTS